MYKRKQIYINVIYGFVNSIDNNCILHFNCNFCTLFKDLMIITTMSYIN